jgi:GT2 family glycosyltransferase
MPLTGLARRRAKDNGLNAGRRRWRTYQAEVEPGLMARPRVHRFARPPVLGPGELEPEPLAVWIEGADRAGRTRAALERGSTAPTVVLDGPLADALAELRSERVVLVQGGDEPAPQALERLGQATRLASDAAVITTDNDRLTWGGRRAEPHLRPGPSPDHWLAQADSGPLLAVDRRQTLAWLGRLPDGPDWRHALAMALAGPASAGHAHMPLILCHGASGRVAPAAGHAAEFALGAWEPSARLERRDGVGHVRRPLTSEPTVEVIVCFRDRPDLLKRCLNSLQAVTAYDNLRLALVDNGSTHAATRELVAHLAARPRVRTLSDSGPFNFSALNNRAARTSDADVLVFLNNDTETVQPEWLQFLLEEALRPEVGAVAPLLLYRDGRVQHAGAAIGLHDYAGHPFAGLTPAQPTPFGQAGAGTRNWLAVTAACLMVERSKFLSVGGFDERFVVAGNDVDLGLRLTAVGHRSLCVSPARLVHDESRSRGTRVDPGDFGASQRSYGAFRTVGDPFYNPSLTLRATDCRLRTPDEDPG